MKALDLILMVLIYAAAAVFVIGWLLVIVDALTGYRLIERLRGAMDSLDSIQKSIWIGLAVVLGLGLIGRALNTDDEAVDWAVEQTRHCERTYKARGYDSVTDCLKDAVADAREEQAEAARQ